MNEWGPDVLGDGFECLTYDLGEDQEGPLVATLVRSLPQNLGAWQRLLGRERMLERTDVLYVHGWSDYFFQKDLARYFTDRGARFFALDLRKYGRSIREGQTACYIEDLQSYDQEIDLAVQTITGQLEEPRRLLLMGHSTGGLVLSLWASRHPGIAEGLMLNSPWLEFQFSGTTRRAVTPVVNLRARLNPMDIAIPHFELDFLSRAMKECCSPEEMASINLDWRPASPRPVYAGWFKAILAGHAAVAAGLSLDVPACVLLSARSQLGLSWTDTMIETDTVIDVDEVAQAALHLGDSVTIERIAGALHDVFLSAPEPRSEAYTRMDRWLKGWAATQG